MSTNENEVTTPEQVEALPAGQWIEAADGSEACLFETHIGLPQRMWGGRANAGSLIRSFISLDGLPLPLHLADLVEHQGHVCQHRSTNECGQCLRCGMPEVGEHRELFFDAEGMRTFQIAAEANSRATA